MNHNPYARRGDKSDSPLPKQPTGFTWWELVVVLGIILAILALLLPSVRQAREPAWRTQCKNNLKQIGLALHNYHDIYGAFPPAYTVDADGRPLHSWRTLILPFIEHKALYDTIDLTKPWDDPANAEAAARIPDFYQCPSAVVPDGFTMYCAFVGEDRAFHATEPRHLDEITDGSSNTLMLLDVSSDNAVHWMAPEDTAEHCFLKFSSETRFAHEQGTSALLVDGSVRFLSADITNADRHALLTIAGDDTVSEDW